LPYTNPITEKLTSICIDLMETENVDGIVSWYLLPFGVTALFIKTLRKVDYIFQHAGSDVYQKFY